MVNENKISKVEIVLIKWQISFIYFVSAIHSMESIQMFDCWIYVVSMMSINLSSKTELTRDIFWTKLIQIAARCETEIQLALEIKNVFLY